VRKPSAHPILNPIPLFKLFIAVGGTDQSKVERVTPIGGLFHMQGSGPLLSPKDETQRAHTFKTRLKSTTTEKKFIPPRLKREKFGGARRPNAKAF